MAVEVHYLKIWPNEYYAVQGRIKNFEARKNDRDFKVNDVLCLQFFDPEKNDYDMRLPDLVRVIDYVLDGGQFGIEPGHCVMAIR